MLVAALGAMAMAGTIPAAANAAPTFLAPTSLSLDGNSAYLPQVAVGPNGDAVAAWIRNSSSGYVVQAATRSVGGVWSAAQTVSGVNARDPQVAVDAAGNAIVVFDDGGVRYADAPAGHPFGASQLLSSETQATPQVAMDAAGDTFVAFVAGVSPNVSITTTTRPAGGTFGAAQPVSIAGRNPYRARIVADARGDAIVAWTASDATTGYLEDAYRPAGGQWGAAQTLDTGGKNIATPDVAIAGDGSAVATWLQDLGTGYAVRVATDVPGVATAPVTTVAPSTELPTDPTLGAGPDGSATVAWTEHATPKQVVRESTRVATGQAFSAGVTISPPAEGADFPVVAMGPSGRTTIVWQSAVDPSTIIVRASSRDVPTGLFPASTRLTTTNEFGYDPQVDADADGDAMTVWRGDVPGINSYVIRAAGLDAAGPQLRALSVPAAGVTGASLSFSTAPLDVFSGVTSTTWDFGDGATASGAAVSHAYGAAGSYTVKVTAADSLGNVSTASRTVTITTPPPSGGGGGGGATGSTPVAAFSAPTGDVAAGSPVVLDASTSFGDGLRYAWDLDGSGAFATTSAAEPVLVHTFEQSGRVTVRLRVTDARGRTSVAAHDLSLVEPPAVSLTVRPARPRAGQRGRFAFGVGGVAGRSPRATLTTKLPDTTTWTWHDGDAKKTYPLPGGSAFLKGAQVFLGADATHTFEKAAQQVAATANWGSGLTVTETVTLQVEPGEDPNLPELHTGIFHGDVVAGQPVKMADLTWVDKDKTSAKAPQVLGCAAPGSACDVRAADPGHPLFSHTGRWSFGDGACTGDCQTGPGKSSVAHVYANPGTYKVVLDIKTSDGRKRHVTDDIVVDPPQACTVSSLAGVPVTLLGGCADGYWEGGAAIERTGPGVALAVGTGADRLVIRPDEGGLIFNPKSGTVVGSSKPDAVLLTGTGAKPIVLRRGALSVKPNAGVVVTSRKESFNGFEIVGGTVLFAKSGPPKVHLNLKAPPPLDGGISLDVPAGALRRDNTAATRQASPRDATSDTDAQVAAPPLGFGPFKLNNATLRHHRDGAWTTGGAIDGPGISIDATDTYPSLVSDGFGNERVGGIWFKPGGAFAAGASAATDVPLGSLAKLTHFGLSVQTQPFAMSGNATVDSNVSIAGTPLISLNGCLGVVNGRAEDAGRAVPLCGFPGYTVPQGGDFVVTAGGKAKIIGFDFLSMNFAFHKPPTDGPWFSFDGGFDYDIGDLGLLTVSGHVFGLVGSPTMWQTGGDIRACEHLIGDECLGAGLLLSNKGVGGCVYIPGPDPGGYYNWQTGDFHAIFGLCDFDNDIKANIGYRSLSEPYDRLRHVQRAAAMPLGASTSVPVKLPASDAVTVLGVTGAPGTPPKIQVQGPGITAPLPVYTKMSDIGRQTSMILPAPRLGMTYVFLQHAAAGTYTVTSTDGQAITGVSRANSLPSPHIQAKVVTVGGGKALQYHVDPLPGQEVTFQEQGPNAYGLLGSGPNAARAATVAHAVSASRPSGTVRFTPAQGAGGKRRIVALVTQNGRPRAVIPVASYVAPPPRRPGRPLVRTRVHGSTLRIAWTPVSGATAYDVSVNLADGRRLRPTRRRTALVVRDFVAGDRASIKVTALRGSSAGRPAAASARRRPARPVKLVL